MALVQIKLFPAVLIAMLDLILGGKVLRGFSNLPLDSGVVVIVCSKWELDVSKDLKAEFGPFL